jgi:hypothetical protein
MRQKYLMVFVVLKSQKPSGVSGAPVDASAMQQCGANCSQLT